MEYEEIMKGTVKRNRRKINEELGRRLTHSVRVL